MSILVFAPHHSIILYYYIIACFTLISFISLTNPIRASISHCKMSAWTDLNLWKRQTHNSFLKMQSFKHGRFPGCGTSFGEMNRHGPALFVIIKIEVK